MGQVELSEVVSQLADYGYRIERRGDGHYTVINVSECNQFDIVRCDDWLQITQILLPSGSSETARIAEFALALHMRCFGCRLAVDNGGNVCIVADVYPFERTPSFISQILTQLACVGDLVQPLLEEVARTGRVPSEADLDAAFG
jgi:hypothetical protein